MTDGLRAYERWLGVDRLAGARPRGRVRRVPGRAPDAARPPRRCWRRFGYRDAGWPEDYDLVLRLLAAGHEIGVVPRRLLAWRDGPARLTRTHPAYALERIDRVQGGVPGRRLPRRRDERYVLWGYGGTGTRARTARCARTASGPSHVVEVHAGRLGNVIHGAPVVPPEALADLPGRSPGRLGRRARRRAARSAGSWPRLGWVETRDFVCAA